MNFTREPIILSVISPKEGFKLVLRNTLGGQQEDFFVDAIEIVAFDRAIFYRSLERPKSFLLPTTHYELLEVKEARMVLKNVAQEKSIKIGGGNSGKTTQAQAEDKRRNKRRKPSSEPVKKEEPTKKEQGGDAIDETNHVSSSVLKKLFPPPNTLIKEKLARFKNEEFFEENILPIGSEEGPKEEKPPVEDLSVKELPKEEAPKEETSKEKLSEEKGSSKEEPPKSSEEDKEKK